MQFYIDELDLELSSFLPQWALLGLNRYANTCGYMLVTILDHN